MLASLVVEPLYRGGRTATSTDIGINKKPELVVFDDNIFFSWQVLKKTTKTRKPAHRCLFAMEKNSLAKLEYTLWLGNKKITNTTTRRPFTALHILKAFELNTNCTERVKRVHLQADRLLLSVSKCWSVSSATNPAKLTNVLTQRAIKFRASFAKQRCEHLVRSDGSTVDRERGTCATPLGAAEVRL